MLRIRFSRTGRKGQPAYRIVLAEHARAVQGEYLTMLGHYNPVTKVCELEKEAITSWIAKGAKPSQSVARLLKANGMKDMEKFIPFVSFKKKETPEVAA